MRAKRSQSGAHPKAHPEPRPRQHLAFETFSYIYPSFILEKCEDLEGDLIGLANEEASLTLEPAAQLEISIAPYCAIADIVRVYTEFRGHVDSFLRQLRQNW
mgnify:CR=1 FL=1